MPYASRHLDITEKPMGPTAAMGALVATVAPAPLMPAAAAPTQTTFAEFWATWGDVIIGLSVVWGILAALPGRRV